MTVIVAATANAHKFEEYRELLGAQDAELQCLLDYPGFTPSPETGKTLKKTPHRRLWKRANIATAPPLPMIQVWKSPHWTTPPASIQLVTVKMMLTALLGSCANWRAKVTVQRVLSAL